MYTISYLKAGHTSITIIFAVVYLFAALLQVRQSCWEKELEREKEKKKDRKRRIEKGGRRERRKE